MSQIKNYYSGLHNLTKRDCFSRMIKEKVHCMEIAKKYDKEYWDGDRNSGYGGYKYIPGRWKPLAELLIKNYNLGPDSRVLDIGCGKGFLLYEMLLLEPKLMIFGCDVSKYAIRNSKEEIKSSLFVHNVKDKFNYKDKEFDLVISLGVFHNLQIFELKNAITEMERIGKQGYLLVEAYRSNQELFNLQCWGLTAVSLFSKEEWIWIYDHFGYKKDYEFYYF